MRPDGDPQVRAEVFRAMVEESLVGLYAIENQRFVYTNASFAEMLGYSVEEVLNLQSVLDVVAPSERSSMADNLRRRLSGEMPKVQSKTHFVRRDGSLVDVEIFGSSMETGSKRLLFGTVIDITSKLAAERHLAEREEYFRTLMENICDVTAIVDANLRVSYVSSSAQKVLGYMPEELVAKPLTDLVHPEQRESVRSWLEQLHTGESPDPLEYRVLRSDGAWRSVESSGTNLLSHPQIRGAVVTLRDVTEQKDLQRQLEQTERIASIGRLASRLAHDFNNVLMAIQPFVTLIRNRFPQDQQIEKFTSLMSSSIERGRNMTHGILNYTRTAPLSCAVIDVSNSLGSLKDRLRLLLGNDISLNITVPDEPLYVYADNAQLTQTFIALATNARDAMAARGGTLTIRAVREQSSAVFQFAKVDTPDRFVHFTISDTGEGISENNLEHIFEPLFTTRKGAAGMGLAFAHQIVMRHGGKIFAESEPGYGTTFHLFIPAAHVDPGVGAITPVATAPSSLRSLRLLLVEDELVVGAGIAASLEQESITVRLARRAEEVIPQIEQFSPDIVLLDIGLPDRDGRDVFKEIEKRWPDLPVIFSTGHVTADALAPYLGPKVKCLLKPYTSEDLLVAIGEITRNEG